MYSFAQSLGGIFRRACLCLIGTIEDIKRLSEPRLHLNVNVSGTHLRECVSLRGGDSKNGMCVGLVSHFCNAATNRCLKTCHHTYLKMICLIN